MEDLEERLNRLETKIDVLISLCGQAQRMMNSSLQSQEVDTQYPQETKVKRDSSYQLAVLRNLTTKQHATLQLLVEGRSNAEISNRLKVGENTVKVHVKALCGKLGLKNRSQTALKGHEMINAVTDEEYIAASGGLPRNWASTLSDTEDDKYHHLYARR
jgi:DNA-binding NarL/FixJ family response regulator